MSQPDLLDEYFPRDANGRPILLMTETTGRLRVVVGGSLSKRLSARLDTGQSVEDLAVGSYVVEGGSVSDDSKDDNRSR